MQTNDFDAKIMQLEIGIKVIRNYTKSLIENPNTGEDVAGRMKEFELYVKELAGMASFMERLHPTQVGILQNTIAEYSKALEELLTISKKMAQELSMESNKTKQHARGASAYIRSSGGGGNKPKSDDPFSKDNPLTKNLH